MKTTSEHCDTCHGTGDVPTGHTNHWGPVWGVCPECEGEGVVYICRECMDTGIDLAAPFNGENPPPCPCCHVGQETA